MAAARNAPVAAAKRLGFGVRAFYSAVTGLEASSESKAPSPKPVSLTGEEGKRVAENLALLASGGAHVEALGPSYYRDPDGTIGVVVDAESEAALEGLRQESRAESSTSQ